MDYKGVSINFQEIMPGKSVPIGALTYQDTEGSLYSSQVVYSAASKYGTALALEPQRALDDVKQLIDGALKVR